MGDELGRRGIDIGELTRIKSQELIKLPYGMGYYHCGDSSVLEGFYTRKGRPVLMFSSRPMLTRRWLSQSKFLKPVRNASEQLGLKLIPKEQEAIAIFIEEHRSISQV